MVPKRGRSTAELTAAKRDRLRKSDFAYMDEEGEGHLPIHDEEHARNALARWNQTHFESAAARESARKKILRAAKKFGIEVSEDDKVMRKH
jgi:hypothetical protein